MKKVFFGALAFLTLARQGAIAEDFVPGRPGNTESPIAVPQGRFQLETEIASASHASGGGDTRSFFQSTLRYGVARNWDVELIVAPFNEVKQSSDKQSGFGDVTLRARHTFADGENGAPSFALIGYITLPTAENGLGAEDVEAGMLATGGFDAGADWSATWTVGAGAVSDGQGYEAQFSAGIALGRNISDTTAFYIEPFAEHSFGETALTLDIGATHLMDAHTQLDAGVDIGVNDNADDYRVFFGWAHLF